MIAAENLKYFIKDFPELEDDAINAVYDLCEDQVTKVRFALATVPLPPDAVFVGPNQWI